VGETGEFAVSLSRLEIVKVGELACMVDSAMKIKMRVRMKTYSDGHYIFEIF